ncbi:MAG: hypothetical protein AAB538_03850 [Patescibacteria group bacterium]
MRTAHSLTSWRLTPRLVASETPAVASVRRTLAAFLLGHPDPFNEEEKLTEPSMTWTPSRKAVEAIQRVLNLQWQDAPKDRARMRRALLAAYKTDHPTPRPTRRRGAK